MADQQQAQAQAQAQAEQQAQAAQNQILFDAAVHEAARQHAQVYQQLASQLNDLSKAFREQGLISGILTFEGDSKKYKEWVQAIEKVAMLAEMPENRKRLIAYQTATGTVAEFLGRFIKENPLGTWEECKRELAARFGELDDPQAYLSQLRNLKQKKEESVQIFAERLLSVAADAFRGEDLTIGPIQRQLIGYLVDGLYYDYLRIKIMRTNPNNLQAAVLAATQEQNIRKRLYLRSNNNSRIEEPMEVDHSRFSLKCRKCGRKGHISDNCRTRPVNVVENVHETSSEPRKCWVCGQPGHYKNDCPHKGNQFQFRNATYHPNSQTNPPPFPPRNFQRNNPQNNPGTSNNQVHAVETYTPSEKWEN